jgi:NADH:ubiquinone oxidoreductase subunit
VDACINALADTPLQRLSAGIMSILGKIFTWWNGATVTTMLDTALKGERVGTDAQGNGANDASRVPAEWHGWLHGSFDGVPESNLPPPRIWEVDFTPNATGTATAYRPQGALERGGKRASATGDYEAWSPEV